MNLFLFGVPLRTFLVLVVVVVMLPFPFFLSQVHREFIWTMISTANKSVIDENWDEAWQIYVNLNFSRLSFDNEKWIVIYFFFFSYELGRIAS